MASTRTLTEVTVPGVRSADASPDSNGSDGSWERIGSSPGSSPASVGSNASSEGPSDLSFWFQEMRVPDHKQWARKFYAAGQRDMDELAAANLDRVFAELAVPSGIQSILRTGIQQFQARTLGQNSMPQGDLDATAPVQSKGINWWFWGGVAATMVVAAAGGAMVVAAQAAAEAAAAAAATAAAEDVAAVVIGGAGAVGWALTLVALGDCLDGETLVTMADRSKKKIKDVKVGDKILSYNKNKLRVKTVTEVKEGSSNTMRELFLQAPDGKEFMIKATGGHPFYTKEKAWAVVSPDDAHFDASKPVKKLAVGDTLVLRGGAGAKLVKIGEVLPTQKTYNLAIDGPGTFFVEGILSHSGLPPKKWRGWVSRGQAQIHTMLALHRGSVWMPGRAKSGRAVSGCSCLCISLNSMRKSKVHPGLLKRGGFSF